MKKIKPIFFALALLSLAWWAGSCDRHDCEAGYCSEQGVITGLDPRDCICCGGWFVEIEGETLRTWALPAEFVQNLDPAEFPLAIYLEWAPVEMPCLGDEIEVTCIRRR